MAKSIRCQRVNHMNLVLQNYEASVAHFQSLYGAEFLADIPQRELRACLVEIGRVLFELFVPHEFLLNARYGAHYVGLEYQADMDEVREVVAAHGIRIIRDIGVALHTHPADCFGIAFEFYAGQFLDREWTELGGKMKPADYWRDEHALGLTGLKGYTVAVQDIAAAQAFFRSFVSAEVLYEAARPAIAARSVGMRVGGSHVELLTPAGEGELERHLRRYGDGIRSTVFGVKDLEQARQYFAARKVQPATAYEEQAFSIRAEENLGVLFEFAA